MVTMLKMLIMMIFDWQKYQIHNPKYHIHNPKYQKHNHKYQMHNPKYQIHNPKYHMQNPKYKKNNPKYQIHNPKYQIHNPKYHIANPKYQICSPEYQVHNLKCQIWHSRFPSHRHCHDFQQVESPISPPLRLLVGFDIMVIVRTKQVVYKVRILKSKPNRLYANNSSCLITLSLQRARGFWLLEYFLWMIVVCFKNTNTYYGRSQSKWM